MGQTSNLFLVKITISDSKRKIRTWTGILNSGPPDLTWRAQLVMRQARDQEVLVLIPVQVRIFQLESDTLSMQTNFSGVTSVWIHYICIDIFGFKTINILQIVPPDFPWLLYRGKQEYPEYIVFSISDYESKNSKNF